MSKWKAFCSERGQSFVEFGLTLPILLLLMLGVADLGLGFSTYIGLTTAAREGARWISTHPQDVDGALARVAQEAERVNLVPGDIGSGGISITLSPDKDSYTAGEKVTVTVSHEYELLFGIVTGLPNVPFDAKATMVVLYDE